MSVRRFDLGSPAWAQLLDDGIKMFSVGVKDDLGRETVITLPVDMTRALCAALIECGFGPEVGVCRWTAMMSNQLVDCYETGCGRIGEQLTGRTPPFSKYVVCRCGKRIEVVK